MGHEAGEGGTPMPADKRPTENAPESSEGTYVRVGKLRDVKLMRGACGPTGYSCVTCTVRGTERGVVLKTIPIENHSVSDGTLLREATGADLHRMDELESLEKGEDFLFCECKIRELGLPMRLRAVERLFGGEQIIFFFTAEGRVDFRKLVRLLARQFQTRIELRQIGARDDARLIGDSGDCGRAICCRSWLTKLRPVTLPMVKNQARVPQGEKNLGVCGRLKCCLRFENDLYTDLKMGLPKFGSRLHTTRGTARVEGVDVLAGEVLLRGEDGVLFRELAADLLPRGDSPSSNE